MNRQPWILALLVVAAAPVACELTFGGPAGPGGTGTSGFAGSGTGHASGNGSGSGSGGASGAGGGTGTGMGGSPISGDQCNPVTGDGCPADGSTCDLDQSGYFSCFPPPNTIDVCGACDDSTTFCGSDLTCVLPSAQATDGTCYRYCCTDADCGAGGTCDTSFGVAVLQPANKGDAVGLCVTSTTDQGPACGPPATSPSGGSCVGGYTGGSDGGGPPPQDGGPPPDDGGPPPQDGGPPPDDGGAPPHDGGGWSGDGGHAGRHDGGGGNGG